MRIRLASSALALALLAAPLAAEAQQAGKVYRIGWLWFGKSGPSAEFDGLRQGLLGHNYVEGQNLVIESRAAEGRIDRLGDLALELVQAKVDVIVVGGTSGSLAAKRATSTIPVVFQGVADPIGAGLIQSLARPGGNITGLTSIGPELGGKRLGLLKQVVPKATRVGVLFNPDDRANVLVLKELQNAAPTIGLTLVPFEVRSPGDFENAFKAMARERVHAMFGAAGAITRTHSGVLVELASKARVPALWGSSDFVQAGGLLSYGVDFADQSRRAATYVDKILKGAKPADLPVEQPTKFELVINLKTAKALGLTIPPSVLARADEVIQ
jgi:putative ABC transport system substrate-binding protein